MTIAYYTGMRRGEIFTENGLRWEQVDLVEGSIRLEDDQTKNEEPRVAYMAGNFLMVMIKAKQFRDKHYPKCEYVCHLMGKPFNEIKTTWKTTCQIAGIRGKRFYDFRRTGVRNMIRAGIPETVAMRISGHKTRSVFDRYNITSEKDLKDAASKLNKYLEDKKVTIEVTIPQMPTEPASTNTTKAIEIKKLNTETAIIAGLKEGSLLVIESVANAFENMPVHIDKGASQGS